MPRLKTEKDGRLFAIAAFLAAETEIEEAKNGFSPLTHRAEDTSHTGKPRGSIMSIYRNKPQSDCLKRAFAQLFKEGTEQAINGFFAIWTDYVGMVMEGCAPDTASDLYAGEERGRKIKPWGSITYSDPEAAKAAMKAGHYQYSRIRK